MRIYWLAYGEYRGRRELKPFLRYVISRYQADNRNMAYRFYVTTALQNIPQGKCTTISFYDMLYKEQEEEKTADEIAMDVIAKAGLILR